MVTFGKAVVEAGMGKLDILVFACKKIMSLSNQVTTTWPKQNDTSITTRNGYTMAHRTHIERQRERMMEKHKRTRVCV